MGTDAALDVARRIAAEYADPTLGERAAVTLAVDVIEMRGQLQAARSMHVPRRDGVMVNGHKLCADCNRPHPCPTARALGVTGA